MKKKKRTEAIFVIGEVVGLVLNTEKSEHRFVSREQKVGQSYSI